MVDLLAVRDEYRAQTWAMLIQECNNSGLTKRAFCQQRGICEKSFYYWLWKLRSRMAEIASRCGYGCCCCAAPFDSVTMIDPPKVRNYYIACSYKYLF